MRAHHNSVVATEGGGAVGQAGAEAPVAEGPAVHREAREAILARTQPTIAARLQQHPPETHERIVAYKAFAYEGLIARGEAEVDWARRGLELIDSLEAED